MQIVVSHFLLFHRRPQGRDGNCCRGNNTTYKPRGFSALEYLAHRASERAEMGHGNAAVALPGQPGRRARR